MSSDVPSHSRRLSSIHKNEVLYYRLIQDHIKEMFSIIYTPTEGEAIENYSRIFRRPAGCFLNIENTHRINDDLAQWGEPDDIDYIVVTDGEEILGIGDQGVGGTGIADQIRDAIAADSGKSKAEAAKQIYCVDKPGLLLKSHANKLTHAQIPYSREDSDWQDKNHGDLLAVIKEVKPHVLVGTSTKPQSFTKEIIEEMASHVDRPIVFPLSNPTRLHEADPKDINEWTKGKALIATGSPFPPSNTKTANTKSQNATTQPVSPALALADQSPALKNPDKGLLPDVINVREISVHIAKAVIQTSVEEGLAQEKNIPINEEDLEEWIREQMWDPEYRPLKLVEKDSASRHAIGKSGTAD
ncbi:hypothetical protein DID88_000191 [Monilinia fructigena]|uniref:Malic enzyme NAD-binding domain-containing protein n=1 Tax=Monilinia fructigena TaxID=38457 RepID=A0A395IJN7_9HELO|nr:hypothetical protein DID88_000191 [Monilinia fructigena]